MGIRVRHVREVHAVPGSVYLGPESVARRLRRICGQIFRQMKALNEIGGENSGARVFGVDPRHDDAVFGPEKFAGKAGRFGFLKVVDLLIQHTAHFFELRLHRLPIFAEPHRKQKGREIAKIGIYRSRDTRILNLDGDRFAGLQPGTMNLAE